MKKRLINLDIILKVHISDKVMQSILYHLECCGIHRNIKTGKLYIHNVIEMFFEDNVKCEFRLIEIMDNWLKSCFDITVFNEKLAEKIERFKKVHYIRY